jgi:ribosome maturation protein Sdo1
MNDLQRDIINRYIRKWNNNYTNKQYSPRSINRFIDNIKFKHDYDINEFGRQLYDFNIIIKN